MTLEEVINACNCSIIDVRTREEYRGGSVADAKNIPLNEIPNNIELLKEMNQPLVLCCASGGRSEQATNYLKSLGFDCYNGGSWLEVNYYKANKH